MSTSLLRTTPQGERKAIAGIERTGLKAWTPTEDRVKRAYRHGKKKRIITVPLAPRYVIVETANPHHLIHEVEQVSSVVGSLRDCDVASLRAMDGAKAETIIAKSLAVGQRVTVVSGLLRDHHSVIEAITGPDAIVKIDILGKQTPVTMPLAFLDPL